MEREGHKCFKVSSLQVVEPRLKPKQRDPKSTHLTLLYYSVSFIERWDPGPDI